MINFLRFFRIYRSFILTIIFLALFTLSSPQSYSGTKESTPKYVGSEVCKNCHPDEYKNFMTYAKKATSFRSIERVKKGLTEEEIKQCYHCHTTGYGKPGGFISEEKTPHLKNAGCEVCHGPGEWHAKTKDPSFIKRHLTKEDCDTCHTSERIKAFRYRPLIHGGAH